MKCKSCFEPFDAAQRRPEVLPCGHSVCLVCLQALPETRCPECRRRGDAAARDGARGQARPDLPVLEELTVEDDPTPERKDELLRTLRERRVRQLINVWCEADPAWSLQLLLLAATHVEELRAFSVRKAHLELVLAMPRLKRLRVFGRSIDQADFPAALPPLPAYHVGLRWLCLQWLPRETTFSLIRRHAATLEELHMAVRTPGGGKWPLGCDDLHAALGRCGLARLRRLVLWRHHNHQDLEPCRDQLREVRAALPGVTVQCDECDNVPCTLISRCTAKSE